MRQSEWGRGVWDGLFVVGVVLLAAAVGVSGRWAWVRPSFSFMLPRP